jgi:hypothetical protein
MVVFTAEPRWVWPAGQPTGGRPQSRPHLAEDNPRPVNLKSLAESLPRRKVTWREGTKGKLSAKFAWVRVWPGQGWAEGACAGADALWLLIEERADGKIQVTVGNALAGVPPCRTVRAELPHTAPTSGAWRRNGCSDARAGPGPGETSDRRSARTVPTTSGASGYVAEARAANCGPSPVGTHSG